MVISFTQNSSLLSLDVRFINSVPKTNLFQKPSPTLEFNERRLDRISPCLHIVNVQVTTIERMNINAKIKRKHRTKRNKFMHEKVELFAYSGHTQTLITSLMPYLCSSKLFRTHGIYDRLRPNSFV